MSDLSASDIAAYVGAAAWLPQIASWIYSRFTTPQVLVVPEKQAELGYTSVGPIFNIRLALSAERKDVVLDSLEAVLIHQDGETHRLAWTGMRENLSEISDAAGHRQVVEKDQPAIALKLTTVSLVEKFVRFQDLTHQETQRRLHNDLIAKWAFLKDKDTNYQDQLLKSNELQKLLELFERDFGWKPGRYTVEFRARSPQKFTMQPNRFAFELMPHDVSALHDNLGTVKKEYENLIRAGSVGYEPNPINWTWRNPSVAKA
jgi:hypothetical protein